MKKTIPSLGIVPYIGGTSLLFFLVFLIYDFTINLEENINNNEQMISFGIISVVGFYLLFRLILVSYIRMNDGLILMPRENKYFASRKWLDTRLIQSVDIDVGFDSAKGMDSARQPMVIVMKDRTKRKYYLKPYSKRCVMEIMRYIHSNNPAAVLSQSCMELVELKSPFVATLTENKQMTFKNKWPLVLYLIIFMSLIVLLRFLNH